MKNIVENQGIKTDKPLPMSYEALKAERDALADKCDRLEYNLGNAIVGEQEALQRVNALAVENQALNKSLDDVCDAYENGQRDLLSEAIDKAINLPSPATDAALAAIEARGVEKLAEKLDAEIEQIMRGAFFYDEISSREAISKMVREFGAELREAK
ncbi:MULTISPECIES: hypothetical protein [unclassified Serratia (in: enterobacteria)]|uniref:hypothetical protein n=1 Tax=unclassified Serratia (in: enterobacteria) TaxID=2647522 RepID=UPI0021AE2BD1|nr:MULTISPECIES: hypothetical protein [unclassified Serratia (in: enterobacteria)]